MHLQTMVVKVYFFFSSFTMPQVEIHLRITAREWSCHRLHGCAPTWSGFIYLHAGWESTGPTLQAVAVSGGQICFPSERGIEYKTFFSLLMQH